MIKARPNATKNWITDILRYSWCSFFFLRFQNDAHMYNDFLSLHNHLEKCILVRDSSFLSNIKATEGIIWSMLYGPYDMDYMIITRSTSQSRLWLVAYWLEIVEIRLDTNLEADFFIQLFHFTSGFTKLRPYPSVILFKCFKK